MSTLSTDVQTDAQRVAKMVAGMAELLGVQPPAARLVGYAEALRGIDPVLVAAGIKRAIATWRYPDMPKPADIRAAIDAEQRDRRFVEAPPTDYPPEYVHCTACRDTGWTGEGLHEPVAPGVHPVVRRCVCYAINPVLARLRGPAKYDQSEN